MPVRVADAPVVRLGQVTLITAVAAIAIRSRTRGPVDEAAQIGDEAAQDEFGLNLVAFAELDKFPWQLDRHPVRVFHMESFGLVFHNISPVDGGSPTSAPHPPGNRQATQRREAGFRGLQSPCGAAGPR